MAASHGPAVSAQNTPSVKGEVWDWLQNLTSEPNLGDVGAADGARPEQEARAGAPRTGLRSSVFTYNFSQDRV